MSAAVAYDAVIAGKRAITNRVEHTKLVCQSPGLLLVEPHQGRVQTELLVHRKVERRVQALDEAISAIRITAEVSLSHTRYDVVDAMIAGINGSDGDEEEVPARHECRGVGVAFLFLCFNVETWVSQTSRGAELRDKADVHAFPGNTSLIAQLFGNLYLYYVPLPIAETEGSHFIEMLESPIEASCGVLSARKNYESTCHLSPIAF